jgi:hypothetical protein
VEKCVGLGVAHQVKTGVLQKLPWRVHAPSLA